GVVDPLVEVAQRLVQRRSGALEDLVDERDMRGRGTSVVDLAVLTPGQRGDIDGAEHPRRRGELRQEDLPVGRPLDPARGLPGQPRGRLRRQPPPCPVLAVHPPSRPPLIPLPYPVPR